MKKNILILVIVLFALVAALDIILALNNNSASVSAPTLAGATTAAINKNIAEANGLNADMASFAQDNTVSQELDATLNDVGEINGTTAGMTNDQENLNNLNSDLTALSGDENINKEIDQSLKDVSL